MNYILFLKGFQNLTNRYFLLFCLFIFTVSCNKADNDDNLIISGEYEGAYFPSNGWRTCLPSEVDMDSSKLQLVYEYCEHPELKTDGFLVIRKGYIVAEKYYGNFHQNDRHVSYSVAKSFMSSLIGIAIDQGVIQSEQDKIMDYYPQMQGTPLQEEKKQVTIEHVLTMTAGFDWNEDDYYHSTATNDAFIMGSQNDFIEYVLNKDITRTPGTGFYYSSGESMLLSGIIENASGFTGYEFAMEFLLIPLGIGDLIWDSDPSGHTIGGWGIHATLREYAKFGFLYLNEGNWEGEQIVPESWIEKSISPYEPVVSYYGYQWWIGKGFESFRNEDIPEDTFLAIGIYRQYVIVIPSKDLVIVRMGNDVPSETSPWNTAEFISLVLNALDEE